MLALLVQRPFFENHGYKEHFIQNINRGMGEVKINELYGENVGGGEKGDPKWS